MEHPNHPPPGTGGVTEPRPLRWSLTWPIGLAVVIAVILPPSGVAQWAGAVADPARASFTYGLWSLKILLLVHAVVASRMVHLLPPHPLTRGSNHRSTAGLVGILAAALLLRLPGLSGGLWYDEIQTLLHYVRQPWGVLVSTFDSSNQHLLYSAAARAVFSVAGESAVALRLPAVIFGVASVWAALAFGRRWLCAREAWWCAILLTVSYHHVWFSQNARGYTGLLLGTLVASSLFLDLLRGSPSSSRRVWTYAIVVALSALTHITALVVLAGHGLCWVWRARRLSPGAERWGPLAALVLAGSLTVTFYAPLLPQVLASLSQSGTGPVASEWQNPGWFVAEAARGLIQAMPGGVVVVPVALAVALTGLGSAWRRDLTATMVMLFPLAIMAGLLLATGHNFWPRFFFFGAAFLVQIGIRGGFAVLDRLLPLSGRHIGAAGLAALTVGSLALMVKAWGPKQDYPAAQAWVAAHAEPGDAVVGTEMMELPMNQWLDLDWDIVADLASLQAIEAAHPRTLLVYTFPIRLWAASPSLSAYLESDYRTVHVVPGTVGGGGIMILAKAPLSPVPESVP